MPNDEPSSDSDDALFAAYTAAKAAGENGRAAALLALLTPMRSPILRRVK
jgi:hypothetical protein